MLGLKLNHVSKRGYWKLNKTQLALQVLGDFSRFQLLLWMTSSGNWKVNRNHNNQENMGQSISNFVVNIVPGFGLAPLDARASATRVIKKTGSCIFFGAALRELKTYTLHTIFAVLCLVLVCDLSSGIIRTIYGQFGYFPGVSNVILDGMGNIKQH